MSLNGFAHKEEWRKWGKNFLIRVVGWDGAKRWNVYVHIYPGHALFLEATENPAMFNCPIAPLEGVSYFEQHRAKNGAVSCYEWGNDYDHSWHEDWDSERKMISAQRHAEELYEYMETVSRPWAKAEKESPHA